MSDAFENPNLCKIPREVLELLIKAIKTWDDKTRNVKPKKYVVMRGSDYIKIYEPHNLTKPVAKAPRWNPDLAFELLTIARSETVLLTVLESLSKLKEDVDELLRIHNWLCV